MKGFSSDAMRLIGQTGSEMFKPVLSIRLLLVRTVLEKEITFVVFYAFLDSVASWRRKKS